MGAREAEKPKLAGRVEVDDAYLGGERPGGKRGMRSPTSPASPTASIAASSSNSWWQATGGMPVYTSAKAAVHGMTRSLARDLGPHRIRVNTVVPGWVMTKRQKTLWATPEALERHRARQCLPDLIEPVYLARMVLFLASDDAAMCTANNYMVEAGSI